jgi:hypothetical protein
MGVIFFWGMRLFFEFFSVKKSLPDFGKAFVSMINLEPPNKGPVQFDLFSRIFENNFNNNIKYQKSEKKKGKEIRINLRYFGHGEQQTPTA